MTTVVSIMVSPMVESIMTMIKVKVLVIIMVKAFSQVAFCSPTIITRAFSLAVMQIIKLVFMLVEVVKPIVMV